jgi:hypothetical protein
MHLRSQLMLSEAIIQAKDASIQSLNLTVYRYEQFALEHAQSDKSKNEEDVIKGVLAVRKFDGKGFSVDLPEIFRRLKRRFGGK